MAQRQRWTGEVGRGCWPQWWYTHFPSFLGFSAGCGGSRWEEGWEMGGWGGLLAPVLHPIPQRVSLARGMSALSPQGKDPMCLEPSPLPHLLLLWLCMTVPIYWHVVFLWYVLTIVSLGCVSCILCGLLLAHCFFGVSTPVVYLMCMFCCVCGVRWVSRLYLCLYLELSLYCVSLLGIWCAVNRSCARCLSVSVWCLCYVSVLLSDASVFMLCESCWVV